MKNLYIVLLFIFLALQAQKSQAQIRPNSTSTGQNMGKTNMGKTTEKGRFIFGGNFGFNILNGGTQLQIAPIVGYKVNDKCRIGAGPSFQYYKQASYSVNAIGGRAFAQYDVLNNLFLQAEYSMESYKQTGVDGRQMYSRLPVGGGYWLGLGGTRVGATVMYDLLFKDGQSPYASPFIIQVGGFFGL